VRAQAALRNVESLCSLASVTWPMPPWKCPVVSDTITDLGSAAGGRRHRYWAMAMIAFGPLSSTALVPSVCELRITSSSVRPGISPRTLRLTKGSVVAVRVRRTGVPAAISASRCGRTARSTKTPGTGRGPPPRAGR
jgi:hypothetical protein